MKKNEIHSYSSFEDSSDLEYTVSEDEEAESSKFIHGGKRSKFIPNPYVKNPQTIPRNKLKLNNKLISNPKLRMKLSTLKKAQKTKLKGRRNIMFLFFTFNRRQPHVIPIVFTLSVEDWLH